MVRVYSFLLIFILSSSSLFAQEMKVNAQFRYRGEFAKNKSAFNTATFGDNLAGDSFGLLRSRIGLTFTGTDDVSAFFQLQDSRRLGEETSTLFDANADQFDLHQGFLVVNRFLSDDLSLKLGRMEISLGNQRFIGAVRWSNTGRSFDGALLERKNNPLSFTLFGASIHDEVPTLHFDPDENLYGLFGSYKQSEARTINGFAFLNTNSDRITGGPDDDDLKLVRLTAGFDYTASVANFSYEFEGAAQFGKQDVGLNRARDNIKAYMYGFRLKYLSPNVKKPFIGVGYDFLSGDDNPLDGDNKSFDTLFATNHKFYGFMDYFINIPAATSQLGLQDFMVNTGFTPRNDIIVAADWHYLRAHEENDAGNSAFRNELDVTLRYNYRQDLGFQAGVSLFIPGEIPDETPNNDTIGYWSYVMLTYNFSQ